LRSRLGQRQKQPQRDSLQHFNSLLASGKLKHLLPYELKGAHPADS